MLEMNKHNYRTIIMLLVTGGIIYFLFAVKTVLIPFFLGIILAYLFYPLVCFLREYNVSRTWAIYIMVLVFLLLMAVIVLIVFPLFLNELEGLTKMAPKYINTIDSFVDYLNSAYKRVRLPPVLKEIIDRTLVKIEEGFIATVQNFTEILINSLSFILILFIVPFIGYYLLRDLDEIKKNILRIIPKKYRRIFFQLGVEINKIFVGYLRGQIWISLIVGLLSGIGLMFFQVRFFIILGLFSGLTNMIPYIGPFIGAVPAIFFALLSSPIKALGVLILYVFIQQLESTLISPKIMSESVGLHPLTVIFSLMVGAELMGVWGMLFAIPLAGSIKVIGKFFLKQFILIDN